MKTIVATGDVETAVKYLEKFRTLIVSTMWSEVDTIILPPKALFSEEVIVDVGYCEYRAIFTDYFNYKALVTIIKEHGEVKGNKWFIHQDMLSILENKADTFYQLNRFNSRFLRVNRPYKELTSELKTEFIRVKLDEVDDNTLFNLKEAVKAYPFQHAWVSVFDKVHYGAIDRVVTNIDYL